MLKKTLHLYIVTAILAVLVLGLSAFAEGATAPVATFLGYYALPGGGPARIATDNIGRVYVSDSNTSSVRIYSNNGSLLKTINIDRPLGIAVDQLGRIFVGSSSEGSVSIFNIQGTLLYKLGSGNGEFRMPNDIAVSSTGVVYVTDSKENLVKAYSSSSGAFLFSFGFTEGIRFPTGIAVDDTAGEVYVSDHVNNVVRVYGPDGSYKRYISNIRDRREILFVSPQGLALDDTRLYVADAYNHTIAVFGKDGVFLSYIGHYGEGDSAGELRTPLDVAIDKNNKLFVTNHNNSRVEVIGIDNYTLLNVNPGTLYFSITENGSPATQTVNLTSSGSLAGWVASTTDSWVSASPSAGSTPQDVSITVNPSGMSAGNYTAQVMFSLPSGTAAIVKVYLDVKPQNTALRVVPNSITLKYQKGSDNLPSANVSVTSTGKPISWTASGGADWLKLDSVSGITPSNIKFDVTEAVRKFKKGTYSTAITINGGAVDGSPATVDVTLVVTKTGTLIVTTNLEQAGFDITGPENYSGSGTRWSSDEMLPGDYTISFRHVSGFIKPHTREFKIRGGKETVIDGQYRVKPVATHLVAGSGASEGSKVVVLKIDGSEVLSSFVPFATTNGLKVAAGDITGSGIDSIVVTDRRRAIKAFTAEGVELASIELSNAYQNAEVVLRDVDDDGIADIIVSAINSGKARREIMLFKYSDGKFKQMNVLLFEVLDSAVLTEDRVFTIALGDINGDGISELIVADKNGVRAFGINLRKSNAAFQLWAVSGTYNAVPQIATGDVNDDGISEIVLSTIGETKVLNGNGTEYGITINPFGDLGYDKPSAIALGRIDEDSADEIVVGAGQDENYDAWVRIFDNDGTYAGVTAKAMEGKSGVSVSPGRFR